MVKNIGMNNTKGRKFYKNEIFCFLFILITDFDKFLEKYMLYSNGR